MKKLLLINIPFLCGMALATETPICEEFAGEPHIQCVAEGEQAIVISRTAESVSYELYKDGKKAFVEVRNGVGVFAKTAARKLALDSIPVKADEAARYVGDVISAVTDDIDWK